MSRLEEPYFSQSTFKLGNFTKFNALFLAELTNFLQYVHVKSWEKKRGKFYFIFHRMPRQADQHFDDILRYVGEFGLWQKFLYFSSCFLVIVSSAIQIASLVFATGTPKFHCVTPNVTCDENKCCAECTSYAFDQSFTSTVTEVRIGFNSCFVTVSAVWTWKRGGRVPW